MRDFIEIERLINCLPQTAADMPLLEGLILNATMGVTATSAVVTAIKTLKVSSTMLELIVGLNRGSFPEAAEPFRDEALTALFVLKRLCLSKAFSN